MVARFNGISMWVTSSIVEPEEIKKRAKVFKKIVTIGKYLLELNSLNALMAVIAGWNNSSVLRLKYLLLYNDIFILFWSYVFPMDASLFFASAFPPSLSALRG